MKRFLVITAITKCVVLLAIPAQAQTDVDFRQLWNACQPIDLVVERTSQDAENIGLTQQRIRTMVESRLRAARIYRKHEAAQLYVNVHYLQGSHGGIFSLRLEYQQLIHLLRYGGTMIAKTWDVSVLGQSPGDAEYIMQGLSEYVDHFINEYLRVNADSCN